MTHSTHAHNQLRYTQGHHMRPHTSDTFHIIIIHTGFYTHRFRTHTFSYTHMHIILYTQVSSAHFGFHAS